MRCTVKWLGSKAKAMDVMHKKSAVRRFLIIVVIVVELDGSLEGTARI
jgi:hypothetical protein